MIAQAFDRWAEQASPQALRWAVIALDVAILVGLYALGASFD